MKRLILVSILFCSIKCFGASGGLSGSPLSGGGGSTIVNGLTNNQSTPVNLNNTLTVAPGGGLGPYIIGKNNGTINGPYVFGSQTIERADLMSWDNTAGDTQYGIYNFGNLTWGGPPNNYNTLWAPYLVGSAGMLTNQMPVGNEMDYMYPVPIFIVNSFFDMTANPNGAYATNTIALLKTVFPGWYNTGWSNVWYDEGMLTNRVGGHLTNTSAAFPQGITGVVTYAHSQGFNIGAYVAHSQVYCDAPGQPTTDEFIYQDVWDVGAMGFDFLKVDNCGSVTPYQGLGYDSGGNTTLTRHYQIFPEANMFMSRYLGRKPLFMLTTEVPAVHNLNYRGAWTPYYTLTAYNLSENGNPPGAAGVFGGNVTNFIFEQTAFYAHRPGHTHRLTSPSSAAAVTKEYVSLCVLGPCSVQVNFTNVIGSGTLSLYYTNGFVNSLITHPLVRPGFEVISNSANHVVTISRPLGPSNGRATSSSSFNGGGFVPGLGLGGYTTFGTDGTNAVGVFNLDVGAHTQVINVNNIGCSSNTPIAVVDVWSGTSQGSFIDQFTTPSIAAGDCALYVFYPAITSSQTSFLNTDQTTISTTFANLTMNNSTTVFIGKKYRFQLELFMSDSTSADGAKIDFNGGTATATNFRMQTTAFDTALNVSSQQTTLSGVATATTFTGSGAFECHGTFEPATSGTFIPRVAQNAHTTGTLTVFRGSNLILTECQ